MTEQNLLELARQGNVKAIATLLQCGLPSQGITVKAGIKKDCLMVLLESDEVPEEQPSIEFIRKNMMQLGVVSIQSVRVYGRRKGGKNPVWKYKLEVVLPTDSSLPSCFILRKAIL